MRLMPGFAWSRVLIASTVRRQKNTERETYFATLMCPSVVLPNSIAFTVFIRLHNAAKLAVVLFEQCPSETRTCSARFR